MTKRNMEPIRDEVARLWTADTPIFQIEAQLGLTKGQVMGHVHRLKKAGVLQARRDAPNGQGSTAKPAAPPPQWRPQKQRKRPAAIKPAAPPPPPAVACDEDDEVWTPPPPQPSVPFSACHWPEGDPRSHDFSFCGARPVVPGRPYCVAHCRVAYAGYSILRKSEKEAA